MVAVDGTAPLRRDLTMNAPAPGSGGRAVPLRYEHPRDAAGQLALVDGVFAGVGGVYLATQSVTVTSIAAAAAVVSAWLARRPGAWPMPVGRRRSDATKKS